jgi:hypothetical protein
MRERLLIVIYTQNRALWFHAPFATTLLVTPAIPVEAFLSDMKNVQSEMDAKRKMLSCKVPWKPMEPSGYCNFHERMLSSVFRILREAR